MNEFDWGNNYDNLGYNVDLYQKDLRNENGYRTYIQLYLNELMLLRQERQVGLNIEACGELVNLFNDPASYGANVKKLTLENFSSWASSCGFLLPFCTSPGLNGMRRWLSAGKYRPDN